MEDKEGSGVKHAQTYYVHCYFSAKCLHHLKLDGWLIVIHMSLRGTRVRPGSGVVERVGPAGGLGLDQDLVSLRVHQV